MRRYDLAVINRSFWPVYPVIGEALLRFAEEIAPDMRVMVVLQDHAGIRAKLTEAGRGQGVDFFPCKAWSTSASGILTRALDACFFMLWVLLVLLWTRPRKVYVSTDPPVLVPFIVMVYAKLFRAKYIYHLQDIHPEAANIVLPINNYVFKLLRWVDALVTRNADRIITITGEMADEILSRSGTKSDIVTLDNPAVSFDKVAVRDSKIRGFSFCGNAGRLQRIPLLVEAIDHYLDSGGQLEFAFAGGGVYAEALRDLASRHANVVYLGTVSASEAAQLNCDYEWALLPIEDEVTRFAFPSKSSSYVFSGACIFAICGEQTSVAQWVRSYNLGVVVSPDVQSVVGAFWKIEKHVLRSEDYDLVRSVLKAQLGFERFVGALRRLVVNDA